MLERFTDLASDAKPIFAEPIAQALGGEKIGVTEVRPQRRDDNGYVDAEDDRINVETVGEKRLEPCESRLCIGGQSEHFRQLLAKLSQSIPRSRVLFRQPRKVSVAAVS